MTTAQTAGQEWMVIAMRLIDADALPKYTGYALSADEVAMAVENAPTIDPVRHGRWIIENDDDIGWEKVTCSECGEDITSIAPVVHGHCTFDYCPYCGAKMEEEER